MKRPTLILLMIILAAIVATSAQAKQWETDFELASSKARKTSKYMLLYFSGSDWCGWCKKFEKEVLNESTFKNYARNNLVCVRVDFPRKKIQRTKLKEQNRELARKYGVSGYPTLFILSPQGDIVAETGYSPDGAKKYVRHLKRVISSHKEEDPMALSELNLPRCQCN